jgi:cytochrome P450
MKQNMHVRAGDFLRGQENFKASEKKFEERPELFHLINESALPPQEKTLKRIAQEGFALIAAGGETTARILTIATFHILDNQDVLQKLKDELNESMVDRMELPNLGALRELPWLVSPGCAVPRDVETDPNSTDCGDQGESSDCSHHYFKVTSNGTQ